MKIVSVETPKVLDYYVSEKYKELIKDKCKNGYCEVPPDNKRLLYAIFDYDPDVFAALRLYASKVEKITNGQMFKYEYELDEVESEGDKEFIINTDKCSFYVEMDKLYLDDKTTAIVVFKLKD